MKNRIKSPWAAAAVAIRKELRKNGVAARVTSEAYSMGSSVDVYLENPLPAVAAQVEKFASQYQKGSFDGMTDSYEFDNKREDLPQVSFVSVNREFTNDFREECWTYVRAEFGFSDAPETTEEILCSCWTAPNGDRASELLQSVLHGATESGFWTTKKERKAA